LLSNNLKQESIYQYLIKILRPEWTALSHYWEQKVREVVTRYDLDWYKISGKERETFVYYLVHEDRQ
jgi:hypothetical protein